MELGYFLAEMGLENLEMFSMLVNADMRWGKFHGRTDQMPRLAQIVAIARAKYPETTTDAERIQSFGFLDLLNLEVELEWVWSSFLEKAGYMLLTGPSNTGKTQLSMDFGIHACLGQPFLGYDITRPYRVGFLSLEMGPVEIKTFMQHQAKSLSKEELDILNERLRLFPVGEPIYFNRQREQDIIEEIIFEEKLDGLIIDSLGAATEKELIQESDAKALMDWSQRVRNRHKCFTWIIHHHRKATSDNKTPNKLSDVYGNQIITARATSVLCLWDTGHLNMVKAIPLKVRLAAKPDSFRLYRDSNLHYSVQKEGISIVSEKKKALMETEIPDNTKQSTNKQFINKMKLEM